MSSDRKQSDSGGTAPRVAAAMESVRAVTDGHGQGSERARLGRLGGGRRVRDDVDPSPPEDDESGGRRRT